jgi:hypothetical protein
MCGRFRHHCVYTNLDKASISIQFCRLDINTVSALVFLAEAVIPLTWLAI